MSSIAKEVLSEIIRTKNKTLVLRSFDSLDEESLEVFKACTHVTSLIIDESSKTDFGFLNQFTQLEYLQITRTRLHDLTFLRGLLNLRILLLNNNKVEDISGIVNLESLETLDLTNNLIEDLTPFNQLIKKGKLNFVCLAGNKIQIIPIDVFVYFFTTIPSFKSHHISILKNTVIKAQNFESAAYLRDLERAGYSIEQELLGYQKLNETYYRFIFHNNPLINPPVEIVNQGLSAAVNYYKELESQGEETIYEARILIIGEAGSGKTSLSRKIKNIHAELPNKIDDTTIGIDLQKHIFPASTSKEKFLINIWDLGGQKRYQPIHQLFFSKRSMYILVVNGREEENLEEFWIPVQELLGGDSPMLILFNQHGKIQPSIPFNTYKSKYQNIKSDLWVVDLLNDKTSIERFVIELEMQVRSLPQFLRGEKLPKKWVLIRNEIEEIKHNYITLKDFREICNRVGLAEIEKQDFVSDYLHDLGVLLRFRDNQTLNKTIFINPKWPLDAIYRVLDHTRPSSNGLFTKEQLVSIWNDPEYIDVTDDLLTLMVKFELCYNVNESTFLVPSLLPSDQPSDFAWNYLDSVIIKYEYDFMPRGIIPRLIVRLNDLISSEKIMWKEGVVLEYQGASALITQFANKRIEVYALGYNVPSLLTIISREIDDINSKYHFSEQMNVKKMIPCICTKCKLSENPHFFEYINLIERDQNGKSTAECKYPPYELVNVKHLLGNVEINNVGKMTYSLNKPVKIFISYSKFDEDYLKDFQDHLITLKDEGLVSTFDCNMIDFGEEWDQSIKSKLNESDIVICLISVKFLNTDYIKRIEIPEAIERGKMIIPIIIKSCDWESSTLGRFQAAQRGRIVSLDNDFRLKDKIRSVSEEEKAAMWTNIIKELRRKVFDKLK